MWTKRKQQDVLLYLESRLGHLAMLHRHPQRLRQFPQTIRSKNHVSLHHQYLDTKITLPSSNRPIKMHNLLQPKEHLRNNRSTTMLEISHSMILVFSILSTKTHPRSPKDSITTGLAIRAIIPNQEPLHCSLERIMLQVVFPQTPQLKTSWSEPRPTPGIPK